MKSEFRHTHPVSRTSATLTLTFLLLCASVTPCMSDDAASAAQAVVRDTADALFMRLRAEGDGIEKDSKRLHAIAEEIVIPHFDFKRMSQRALGRYWREATPEQREHFAAEFKTLLVRAYARAVVSYRNAKINYLAARSLGPDTVRIRTEVLRENGAPPVQIDYEVFQQGTDWKGTDVSLNGVSLVISYRAGFASDIGKLGMDGLIAQLAQHNAGG